MNKLEIAVHEFLHKKQPQAIYQMPDIRMETPIVEIDQKVITKITDAVLLKLKEEKGEEDSPDDEETKALTDAERKQRIEDSTITTLQVLRSINPDLASPAFNKIGELKGFTHLDGPVDAFNHWMKSGQRSDDLTDYEQGGVKAAWQEGTDSEGGYTVPDGMWNRISEKRDEISIARIMGAEVIPVGGKTFNVPLENTRLTDFVITAEEGAWDQDEGDLGQLSATIYNYTKLQKISQQLLEDTVVNLITFFANRWGRAAGLTDNEHFLVGTGSGQPQGAVVGGTAGTVLASASTITAAEVITSYYDLPQPYRDGATFVMKDSTEKIVRGLTGDPFAFVDTPQGGAGRSGLDNLVGQRAFSSDSMAAFAVNAKVILHGLWAYYAILERKGMTVSRNNSLYEATGQVGFFVNYRLGAGVMQAEAFSYNAAAAA